MIPFYFSIVHFIYIFIMSPFKIKVIQFSHKSEMEKYKYKVYITQILTLSTISLYTKKAFPFSNTPVYTRCYNASPGKLYMHTNLHTVNNNRVNCPYNHYVNVYFIKILTFVYITKCYRLT